MEGLTYKYYKKNKSKNIYLIIHGGGPVGVETDFISAIFDTIAKTNNSALCFNFPYCERGEENSSGPDLLEEISALEQVIDFVHAEGYSHITIVAKSLGGIISSYYFAKYPDKSIDLIILGYIPDEIKQNAISKNLKLIIQGENDRFATPSEVQKIVGNKVSVTEIKNADHSYQNHNKEPIYQKEVLNRLVDWI